MSLPQTGVSGFDISGFAVRRWNPTPDLTSLSTVKTRASCYPSSDYFISKSSTINHHPFLEKFNAYAQTEACNQSFTVPGTAGFHRGNRGEPNDTVGNKWRLCLEKPMWCLYLCWAVRKGDRANVVMMTLAVLTLKHGVWLEPRFWRIFWPPNNPSVVLKPSSSAWMEGCGAIPPLFLKKPGEDGGLF